MPAVFFVFGRVAPAYRRLKSTHTGHIRFISFAKLSSAPTAEGCFGKLLICLPADHRGGNLRFTYGGEKKKILTETFSPWGYSYVAW